jgi:hypothetical protein
VSWWKIGPAELQSGGKVRGSGKIAGAIFQMLQDGPVVHVLPHPSEPVPLRLNSDFLLHLFAHDAARKLGLKVETEYELDERDAPPDLREKLRALREGAAEVPYGTVH